MKEEPAVKKGKKTMIEAWEEKQKGFDLVALRKKADNAHKHSTGRGAGSMSPMSAHGSQKKAPGLTNSRRSSGGRNDSPTPMVSSRMNSQQAKRPASKKKRILKMASSGNFSDTKFFEEIRARDRSASLDRIPED